MEKAITVFAAIIGGALVGLAIIVAAVGGKWAGDKVYDLLPYSIVGIAMGLIAVMALGALMFVLEQALEFMWKELKAPAAALTFLMCTILAACLCGRQAMEWI